MSLKMLVEVTREEQIQIEEVCTITGKTFSQYLIGLHHAYSKSLPKKEETPEDWVKQVNNKEENRVEIKTSLDATKRKKKIDKNQTLS